MITISSSSEASYWDGFQRGFVLPGMGGVEAPFHWGYSEEVLFYHHRIPVRGGHYPVFEIDSSEDAAYWMGYASGFAAFSAATAGFATLVGAEAGFLGSAGFGVGSFLVWSAPVTVPTAIVVAGTYLSYKTHELIVKSSPALRSKSGQAVSIGLGSWGSAV